MATISAKKREGKGKYKAFDLRKAGFIPGVVYGKGIADNINVTLNLKDFVTFLKNGERIADLDVDGSVRKVLIKAVQHGTYDHEILHVDFRAVRDDEVVEVEMQIELVGEAAGVKVGGMLEQNLHQVTVRCLPKDMPEKVVVDVASLDMGDIIYADQLPKLAGVAYILHGNPAVVSCHHPAGEEKTAAPEGEVPTAPEVIGTRNRTSLSTDAGPSTASGALPPSRITRL